MSLEIRFFTVRCPMTFTIPLQDSWNLLAETAQTTAQNPILSSFETLVQILTPVSSGTERSFQFSPEFGLFIDQGQRYHSLSVQVSERPHEVDLQIVLSGTFISEYGETIRAGQSHLIGSGIAPQGNLLGSAEPYLMLYIALEPQVLLNFLGKTFEQLPVALQRLTQTQDWQTWVPSRPLTPAMHEVVRQILHCPCIEDFSKQMYLQSKVFELLALHLDPILKEEQQLEAFTKLQPQDIDRIHHAQEILLAQMENPPSLLDLAKQVGTNDHKLETGFRQVFGTTVFDYLLEQRLTRSRLLLEMGEMTVAEAA